MSIRREAGPTAGPSRPGSAVLCWLVVCFLGFGAHEVRARDPAKQESAEEASGLAVEAPLDVSPRNASYRIEAALDVESREIEGRQVLTWRNIQPVATDELCFHLYWNGFRNDHSTWLLADRLRKRSSIKKPGKDDWGFLEVEGARFEGTDRTSLLRYAPPEDNPHDRTVLILPLEHQVEPGETVQVELDWRARVPHTFARTGNRAEYYYIAHWFPKLGVLEPEGWNCHPFHANTEFFSDFGSYDVELTLPSELVVGATGRKVESSDLGNGTTLHRFRQDDVHGFAWTASPQFEVHERRFEAHGLPLVDMRLLLQPEHRSQADRLFDATAATLEHYGRWYGPYPYGHLTIVDPAYQSGTGGMEYPTIFTSGTRLFNPLGIGSPEGVTIHEAGHQFWYGLVANNEFEHAWLDEGLNTFSTARVAEVVYGPRKFSRRYLAPAGTGLRGFLPVLWPRIELSRAVHGNRLGRYLGSTAATADPLGTPSHRYLPTTGTRLSYDKTALMLATLENHLGWDQLQQVLSTFFRRWQYRHPKPDDFFAVFDELVEEDLDPFFDQVYHRSVRFDFAVDSVSSRPVGVHGWVGQGAERVYQTRPSGEDGNGYRTEVVVRRHGGIFPVDVLLVFADGHQVRERWNGAERWKSFVVVHEAKLDHAVVDPDRVLLFDESYTNNSRFLQSPTKLGTAKWASKWMLWLQETLAAFTFFAG